ncbi:Uncharacterised protein [Mycobacteroides abscessus subsp. abscessus]|jgi:predicted transcriptional regulator with HTH domain|uniref:hypothetical protein n=1 Tax=Mycobacteroides abscessus TaxID=36809 RepID=UPI00092AD834|nr:hypothetical protein [Mycobacteroides abscessus]SIH34506.1 Uncharacterised protein [Mycobacteroides abscessus subsp. abscessus]
MTTPSITIDIDPDASWLAELGQRVASDGTNVCLAGADTLWLLDTEKLNELSAIFDCD